MTVECYVVIHNIAKRHNVGTLARSAAAFGVSELILVGRRDFNAFSSHGFTSHLRFRYFHSLTDARLYLKEKDCDICGVEITNGAFSITDHPFKKGTAFLLGNEGTGLSAKECEICGSFVYIPQYGGGTASLNVTVAASIVLHHFGDEDLRLLLHMGGFFFSLKKIHEDLEGGFSAVVGEIKGRQSESPRNLIIFYSF